MARSMNYSHPRWSMLYFVAAPAAAAFLVGCGSGSDTGFVASSCNSARTAVALKLVLRNVAPTPRVLGKEGAAVKIVSSYHGNQMAFPTAHPSKAVCEISQHRSRDGAATVVYKARRKATITFSSTYAHATEAMMPAMLGRLEVVP